MLDKDCKIATFYRSCLEVDTIDVSSESPLPWDCMLLKLMYIITGWNKFRNRRSKILLSRLFTSTTRIIIITEIAKCKNPMKWPMQVSENFILNSNNNYCGQKFLKMKSGRRPTNIPAVLKGRQTDKFTSCPTKQERKNQTLNSVFSKKKWLDIIN